MVDAQASQFPTRLILYEDGLFSPSSFGIPIGKVSLFGLALIPEVFVKYFSQRAKFVYESYCLGAFFPVLLVNFEGFTNLHVHWHSSPFIHAAEKFWYGVVLHFFIFSEWDCQSSVP